MIDKLITEPLLFSLIYWQVYPIVNLSDRFFFFLALENNLTFILYNYSGTSTLTFYTSKSENDC